MAVLAAENVSYTYQSKYQKVQALKNVSCTFEAGKFYAIIGQSGSGKTTLLSMLAGLGTPSEGEIIANGKTLKEIGSERHRRENVTVIYQSFNLFPHFEHTRKRHVPDANFKKKPTKEAKIRAKELLNSVGLGDVDPRKLPAMLSGGQQQRVAIARALASDAKVILADEPTGNLDTENGKVVIDLLKKLVQDENYCVIVVTHDPGIAAQADVVYKMQDGRLAVEC
ncbi:MAG: ABC transporter ATP-binding protein [Hominenteromicrobium sp.]|uniref:ABC transporter ATP-binding protein n=1 Tax=Hominenteromicrobium sp. TaxID=3073581 RepID=UPI0039A37962